MTNSDSGETNSTRKIIHVDMDAFYASVEQRDNPELRGKPVIVGGQPDSRGVVAACSYEARAFGIHSAMPSSRAGRLCPDAIFVKVRFDAYREASRQLHEIFREYTDLIEPLSLDEAFLDVTECKQHSGSATLIAKEIRQKVRERMNLVASAGVSYNKFLAKIASDMDKPDGLYVIRPEQAEGFITTLPVRKFHGVGKVTEQKMHKHGIQTGADMRKWSEVDLSKTFGKSGGYYYRIARGLDDRPVRSNRIRKSIGKENTFGTDLTDLEEIQQKLMNIAEQIAEILKKREVLAKTLTLKVKYNDFTQITRAHSYKSYIQSAEEMMEAVPALLEKTELGQRPCRLLGLSVSNLKNRNEKIENDVELGITRDFWEKEGFKGQIIGHQPARLIPNFSATSKELLSTSVLLATFEMVPTFADELFSDIGVKIGSRSKLSCATEVVFKTDPKKRPDGLIVVKSPTKSWSALIETKIQRNDLTADQIEDYLDIAKQHDIDAVITISNQFALRPTHHPLQISKNKTRKVDLFHFSWSAILGEALLAASAKKINDPEQARIMEEATHYLKTTATCDLRMLQGWKETCDLIRQESNISKTSNEVRDAAISWQQLLRHCALTLSSRLENPVTVYLSKARLLDPIANLKADCEQLTKEHKLTAFFEVPNGASRIEMVADFKSKSLNFRMKLKAPDSNSISKATAAMNWLTRQLRDHPGSADLRIRAFWPRRSNTTDELFCTVLENPKVLIPDGMKELPTYLEIQADVDLGANFKSVGKAAGLVEQALISFYMSYGENLIAWAPRPIKLKPSEGYENGS